MVSIAAKPYDYPIPEQGMALLIIDMQHDFLDDGGFEAALGREVTRLQRIVPAVRLLLNTFRACQLPVLQTIECYHPDLSNCPPAKLKRPWMKTSSLGIGASGPMGRILVRGESGNAIIPELQPLPTEQIIEKPGKGAFHNTTLEQLLQAQAISHLIITGVTTEVSVYTTLQEANDRGYDCLLVEDATESYFPEFKQATLKMIQSHEGRIGWTANSLDVINVLSQ